MGTDAIVCICNYCILFSIQCLYARDNNPSIGTPLPQQVLGHVRTNNQSHAATMDLATKVKLHVPKVYIEHKNKAGQLWVLPWMSEKIQLDMMLRSQHDKIGAQPVKSAVSRWAKSVLQKVAHLL